MSNSVFDYFKFRGDNWQIRLLHPDCLVYMMTTEVLITPGTGEISALSFSFACIIGFQLVVSCQETVKAIFSY